MKPAESSPVVPEGSKATLIVAALASLVWLLLAFIVGWFAESSCDGQTFGCLKANEWGDYLAGVFAPLAFFWLVATVWIQSNELREQRKELALTRQEFADNRVVAEAQAKEANRQAEFIGTQTSIILQKERDQQFLTMLTVLRTFVRDNFSPDPYPKMNTLGSNDFINSAYLVLGSEQKDPTDFFLHVALRLNGAVVDGLKNKRGRWLHLMSALDAETKVPRLRNTLSGILGMRNQVGPANQVLLDQASLAETLFGLDMILSLEDETPPPEPVSTKS